MFDTITGQSRGYGFVEFEREKDMKIAFKEADGIRMNGRRMLVDVERGRTVKGWKPRRLGGGLSSRKSGRYRDRDRERERERERPSRTSSYSGSGRERDIGDRLGGSNRPGFGYRDRDRDRSDLPRDPRDRSDRLSRPRRSPSRRSRSPRRDR